MIRACRAGPVQPFSSVSRAQLISSRWRGFLAGQSPSRLRGARTSVPRVVHRALGLTPAVKGGPCRSRSRTHVNPSRISRLSPLSPLSLFLPLSHFSRPATGERERGTRGTRGSLARRVCACIIGVRRVSRYLRCEFQDGFKRPCVAYSRAAVNSMFV